MAKRRSGLAMARSSGRYRKQVRARSAQRVNISYGRYGYASGYKTRQTIRVTKGTGKLTPTQQRLLSKGHRQLLQERRNWGLYGNLTAKGRSGKQMIRKAGYKPGAWNSSNVNKRRVRRNYRGQFAGSY